MNNIATKNTINLNQNYYGKSPDIERRSIPIIIKRFCTDVDGQLIDKATLPANMQVKYPVYMFGGFDMISGYKAAHNICPPILGANYLCSFVNGFPNTSFGIIGITGLNEIQGQLNLGDIVHVFTDSLQAPNYFVWVVQSTNAIGGLGSIITNLMTDQKDNRIGRLFFYELLITDGTYNQWKVSMNFTGFDNLGNFTNDSIAPSTFKNPLSLIENVIRMNIEYVTNQYMGINTYIDFGVDQYSLDFNIKKI